MITLSKILKGIIFLAIVVLIGSCEKDSTSKTVVIRPAFVKTLVAEQYPTAGWLICPFGASAFGDPGPTSVIVGWDHMVNEGTFCTKASDHIYQGALWFPVSEVIGHRLVTKATLKFSRSEGDLNCLVKLCRSDDPWVTSGNRNMVSVSGCITHLPHQGDNFAIDVSNTVNQWTTLPYSKNNGFILVGPKENFDSFSIKGMPASDGCFAMFQNFTLEITFSDQNP